MTKICIDNGNEYFVDTSIDDLVQMVYLSSVIKINPKNREFNNVRVFSKHISELVEVPEYGVKYD